MVKIWSVQEMNFIEMAKDIWTKSHFKWCHKWCESKIIDFAWEVNVTGHILLSYFGFGQTDRFSSIQPKVWWIPQRFYPKRSDRTKTFNKLYLWTQTISTIESEIMNLPQVKWYLAKISYRSNIKCSAFTMRTLTVLA